MSSGRSDDLEFGNFRLIAPVKFSDLSLRNAPGLKMCTDSKRHHEPRSPCSQDLNSGHVEVIVVVMRDHDYVDTRQFRQRDWRGVKPLRANPCEWRCAFAPDRVC